MLRLRKALEERESGVASVKVREKIVSGIAEDAETVLSAMERAIDPVALSEAMSLAFLFGRRCAEVGGTMFETLALGQVLERFALSFGIQGVSPLGYVLEGYVKGLMENEHDRWSQLLAESVLLWDVEPGIACLVLQGPCEPEWINPVAQRLLPQFLKKDIRVLLLLFHFVDDRSSECKDSVIALLRTIMSIGVHVIAVDSGKREEICWVRQEGSGIEIKTTLGAALEHARQYLSPTIISRVRIRMASLWGKKRKQSGMEEQGRGASDALGQQQENLPSGRGSQIH
ncbi:MAG: hypothetical protein NZM37_08210 [Sandaracinaceae bacterium]|nr:hypothetical protein [Sandaracinaceae bacterium]